MEGKSIVEDNNNVAVVISEEDKELQFRLLDSILAYVLLGLGFCFVHFVVWNVTGIFTTLFFISTAIICLIYLKMSNYKLNKNSRLWFGLTLIFSLVFSITDNNFIKFLDIVFVLMLGIYWVYMVCKDNGRIDRFFFFDMLKAIFIMPFSGFSKAPKAIAYSASRSRHSNNVKLAIIGLVITIPLTALVATLLTSADSGIERMMNFIFGSIHENVITSVMKFFMGIPVAFYIFGMLYSNVRKEKSEVFSKAQCEEKINKIRLTPNMIMYSAVTPICILYIMFFISQLQYFFSAFMGQLPDTYSFAEYARKGFFELCAIAVINLMVLSVINLFSKNTGENKPIMLKIYSVTLSIFTVMIITTALSKMIVK